MGKTTGISWTDHTFNPWWGCVKVSDGCKFCYAETWDKAKGGGESHWGPTTPRRFFGDKHWNEPLAWDSAAELSGTRRLVFCASMADVFEDRPDLIEHRLRLWDLIEKTPHLDWLLLTKRPQNIESMLPAPWSSLGYYALHGTLPELGPFPKNVWLGVSAENEDQFKARWPVLESVGRNWYIPVLFISAEPLLGPIDMKDDLLEFIEHEDDNTIWVRGIDWVIVGGESGANARPMHPQWARSLRDQCAEAEVPYFFKQHGEWLHESQFSTWRQRHHGLSCTAMKLGDGSRFIRVGKALAGDHLDGQEYHEFPKNH